MKRLINRGLATALMLCVSFMPAVVRSEEAPANAPAAELAGPNPVQPAKSELFPATPARPKQAKAAVPAPVVTALPNLAALTLEDCRSLAILRNIDLSRSIIDNRSQELALWNQEGLFLPDLSLSFGHTHDTESQGASLRLSGSSPFGTTISVTGSHDWDKDSADSDITLSITQPLLDGSTRREKLQGLWKARLDAAIQRNSLERKIETTLYDAHSKYIECVKQQLTIEVNRRALDRTRSLYEATRAKESLGFATVRDLADAEATLASRRIALADAIQARDNALDALKKFLDLDVTTDIGLAPVDIALEETEDDASRTFIRVDENDRAIYLEKVAKPGGEVLERKPVFEAAFVDPDKAIAKAMANRLDLVNTRLALAKSYLDAAVARVGIRPDLDLKFTYTRSGTGLTSGETLPLTEESWSGSLSLSLPIGNRDDRTAYEQALLNYQKARLSLREAEQNLKAEVRSMLRELETTGQNVLNYALQVRAAGLGLDSARVSYTFGKTDFFRVLDAENAFLAAQRSYVTAYLSYELLLSKLKQVIGDDSGRLPELVRRGRELSRQLREDLAPLRPEDAVRRLYLKGTRPDAPFPERP